jgi:hypothetical protein
VVPAYRAVWCSPLTFITAPENGRRGKCPPRPAGQLDRRGQRGADGPRCPAAKRGCPVTRRSAGSRDDAYSCLTVPTSAPPRPGRPGWNGWRGSWRRLATPPCCKPGTCPRHGACPRHAPSHHDHPRTLLVLSPAYLRLAIAEAEWRPGFVADSGGEDRRLVPVRVEPCEPEGLLLTGSTSTWSARPGHRPARFREGIAVALRGHAGRTAAPLPWRRFPRSWFGQGSGELVAR